MLLAVPLKSFDTAKGRLAGALSAQARQHLARASALHVVKACLATEAAVAVVTGDGQVSAWADDLGCRVITDPGTGLDAAAAAAVQAANGPWAVVHGDLPLITVSDLGAVVEAVGAGTAVLAPSRDGGTNVLGSPEPLAFAYGPGSFHRHIHAAMHLERTFIVTPGTVVDIDAPDDLIRAAALSGGAWLRGFLPSVP